MPGNSMPAAPIGRETAAVVRGQGMDTRDRENPLLTWGVRGGRMMHVDEVTNGLGCGCVCPSCQMPLIARNRGQERQAHFAHRGTARCAGACETALHRIAKEIICTADRVFLPRLPTFFMDGRACPEPIRDTWGRLAEWHAIAHAEPECRIGEYVADVVLYDESRNCLCIEIVVTHEPGDRKLHGYSALGIPCLVIDLGYVDRSLDRQSLSYLLVESLDHKRWAFPESAEAGAGTVGIPVVELPANGRPDDCHPAGQASVPYFADPEPIPESSVPCWPEFADRTVQPEDDERWLHPSPSGLGRRLLELNFIVTKGRGDWWPDVPMHPEIAARLRADADAGDLDAQECLRREAARFHR